MPISITERPLRGRLAVMPRASGGFTRSDRPNPNSAIETYRRRVGSRSPVGASTSSALPQANALDPTITGSGQSAISENLALAQRGLAMRRAEDEAHAADSIRRGIGIINTVAPDPRWEALKQALYEAGADTVRTGARAGYAPRGFFDTQETMDAGQQQRARLLQALYLNEGRPEQAANVGRQFRI